MNLRALSLDTTPPVDYEPLGTLRWDASLTDMADFFGSDKGSIKHNYTPHYEGLLGDLKNEPIRLVEIGVACGASLKMWSRFFPYGRIAGIDIRPECKELCKGYPSIKIAIADATQTCIEWGDGWDVVIDDGSHMPGHIVKTFKLYWPKVKSGGWYFIEDTLCTHNPGYSVPFPVDPADKDRSHLMGMIDALLRDCDLGGEVESVQCWRELIAVKKRG